MFDTKLALQILNQIDQLAINVASDIIGLKKSHGFELNWFFDFRKDLINLKCLRPITG